MGIISLLTIPPVFALDIGRTLSNVWDKIISVGNLSALGLSNQSVTEGFTRILVWILLFTIFYAVLKGFKGSKNMGWMENKFAAIIAFVIATLSAVFMPVPALLAIGGGFATLFALILIGLPVVGMGVLLLSIPGKDTEETKVHVLIKLVICLILFWVLSVMSNHLGRLI